MQLTAEQLERYERDGFLLLEGLFDDEELEVMSREIDELSREDSPRRVLEKDGVTPRAIHGSHQQSEALETLAAHPRFVEPMRQLLDGDVYLYQFKINLKNALTGDMWPWHQDYVFWQEEDDLPEVRISNAVLYLDDVTDLNGPMFVLRGSHREGVVSTATQQAEGDQPDWLSNLTADLKYSVDPRELRDLVGSYEAVATTGERGSVLIFHPNLVHGSAQNLSPYPRRLIILSYSHVSNRPRNVGEDGRPEFLVSRDFSPLEPVSDDALREYVGEPVLA